MPRNSSSSGSKPLSFKSAVFQTPRAPVPLPRAAAPAAPAFRPAAGLPTGFTGTALAPAAVHHHVKVEQPGFFSNVMQGFGLGAGQSFAFNLFRNPQTAAAPAAATAAAPAATPAAETAASTHLHLRIPNPSKEYIQCMEESKNDEDACRQFIESAGSN